MPVLVKGAGGGAKPKTSMALAYTDSGTSSYVRQYEGSITVPDTVTFFVVGATSSREEIPILNSVTLANVMFGAPGSAGAYPNGGVYTIYAKKNGTWIRYEFDIYGKASTDSYHNQVTDNGDGTLTISWRTRSGAMAYSGFKYNYTLTYCE